MDGFGQKTEKERVRMVWNMAERKSEKWIYSSLEEIAKTFENPSVLAVSFDVFDTLLVRPVEREEDFFELLDKEFAKRSTAQVSFSKLRMEAEAVLRRKVIRKEILQEDISLTDIYRVLEELFGLSRETAAAMEQLEFELELKLCAPRKSGAMLFEKALSTGKPVVLISDMYLSNKQITELLEKNGYHGMKAVFVSSEIGKRKITGNLYDAVAKTIKIAPEKILHIGDNRVADCQMAVCHGFQAAWLPKPLEIYDACGCAHQPEKICSDLTDWDAAKSSVGIGNMRAMAAIKYFDDPFRPFEKTSDYNADPYFIGYGALGMELFAFVRWLARQIRRDQVKHMVFLARDGYLPRKAYELYQRFHPELPTASYLHVSRLSVLPAMIQAPEDLFGLPIDISYQTPRKLLRLLRFCTKPQIRQDEEFWELPMDEPFSRDTFCRFVSAFIQKAYDKEAHLQAIARISDYLLKNKEAPITEHAALFDMGYSGRISSAIINATKCCPKIYYFHADSREHFRYQRRTGMEILAFFDFSPYMESSLREYSYLEPAPSCIAYTDDLQPVYDVGPAKGYQDVVLKMQKGALDFIQDYLGYFAEYEQQAQFREHEAAMPFEAFLRYCSPYDRSIYEHVLMDDELWGGRRDIDLKELMEIRLKKIPGYAKKSSEIR